MVFANRIAEGVAEDGFVTVPGVLTHQEINDLIRAVVTKAGVIHVQPPVEILASMPALRIHLDDCKEANGPAE